MSVEKRKITDLEKKTGSWIGNGSVRLHSYVLSNRADSGVSSNGHLCVSIIVIFSLLI